MELLVGIALGYFIRLAIEQPRTKKREKAQRASGYTFSIVLSAEGYQRIKEIALLRDTLPVLLLHKFFLMGWTFEKMDRDTNVRILIERENENARKLVWDDLSKYRDFDINLDLRYEGDEGEEQPQ